MTMRVVLNRILKLFGRDQATADLEDEMRLHMQLRAERLRAEGMPDADVASEARRRFGNVTNAVESSRDAWGFVAADTLFRQIRQAGRRLRLRPGLSVPVIAMLALGIGATTAVFSAVDAAILRPLPFPRAHDLYVLSNVQIPMQGMDDSREGGSLRITDVAAMTGQFTHVAAYAAGGLNLADPDRPQRLNVGVVTNTFFSTLGVRPLHGRTFNSDEGRPNGSLAVVLSHGLWQRQFGGEDVIGRAIVLNSKSYEVVGVMPPGFTFPQRSDVWIPLPVPMTFATFEPFRGWLPSSVVARGRPELVREELSAQLLNRWQQSVAPATGYLRKNLDETLADLRAKGPMVPLQRQLVGTRRPALLVLLGATGLLLLIACANVANLLLSDAANRRREIAMREVLGASRGRIAGQLLTESLLLAAAGTALGLLLAPAALRVLQTLVPARMAGVAPAHVDLRVLAFAAILALVTSLLFGLWPLFNLKSDPGGTLKSGGHGATTGGLGRVRSALVLAEVALTVVLLVGAGLMIRSFGRMMAEEMGLDPDHVATLETSFPRAGEIAEHRRIVGDMVTRLAAHPEITAVGIVNDLPLRGSGGISITVESPGVPTPKGIGGMVRTIYASSGYFSAMGMQLLRGRIYTDAETPTDQSPRVAVVSKALADAYWPGQEPIGRHLNWRGDTAHMTVIGVVADVRELALDRVPTPQMYLPSAGLSPRNVAIVARGSLPQAAFLARLGEAMRAASPTQAVYNVRMMEDVVSESISPRRTNTLLIVVFASLALVMAALGVYAVLAYGVAQRTREFGIRSALGATGADIVRLVSRDMARVLVLGIAAGLLAAWMLGRLMTALLYEVDARDPATFLVAPLALLLPAILATLIPALRAVRVDPTKVLREE